MKSTLSALIDTYVGDHSSRFQKLSYRVRTEHGRLLSRIKREHGASQVAEINGRILLGWYQEWTAAGKTAMAHALVTQLRSLFGYGDAKLDDRDCRRLRSILRSLRFKLPARRWQSLSAEQATAIRQRAHYIGNHSIAMAQAFQFECSLRQKDVIGEWVPVEEPGEADIIHRSLGKWLRGIRWEEIDDKLILRHTTSLKKREFVFDLKIAPMVMEELVFYYGISPSGSPRSKLPESGPVVLSEYNALPYVASEFRRKWRQVADGAGVPKEIRNVDSRAGAIKEARDAGVNARDLQHLIAAT